MILNYHYNHQLNITSNDKIYVYQFKEGNGFIENQATFSQKRAIWKLINNMVPTEKIEKDETLVSLGGYFSFYFIKDDIKTVFSLEKLNSGKLYVIVNKVYKEGNILESFYFLSDANLANRIKNIIFIN